MEGMKIKALQNSCLSRGKLQYSICQPHAAFTGNWHVAYIYNRHNVQFNVLMSFAYTQCIMKR